MLRKFNIRHEELYRTVAAEPLNERESSSPGHASLMSKLSEPPSIPPPSFYTAVAIPAFRKHSARAHGLSGALQNPRTLHHALVFYLRPNKRTLSLLRHRKSKNKPKRLAQYAELFRTREHHLKYCQLYLESKQVLLNLDLVHFLYFASSK